MLKSANLAKEIVITVANKIGVLGDISGILSDQGLNIEAAAGYAEGNQAKIMLVTVDNPRAVEALKKMGYDSIVEKESVMVELEDKPGALKSILAKLTTAGIDIKYIYGTTCSAKCPGRLVITTSDNGKALEALKK
ncbi:MAG: ACT domain-containing protein [Candidatus Omnitrophota bacterium]